MSLLRENKYNRILHLSIDDSSARNAFSYELARQLHSRVAKKDFSAMVLTAEGRHFCSGGNLSFYKGLSTKQEGLEINSEIADILNDLNHIPVPKLCYVQGPCYGGGVELISCFDFIWASPSSLFGLWQRRVGLSYGWGGKARLEKRISQKHLQAWLLAAETRSSYQALEVGLIDKIVLKSQALDLAVSFLENLLGHGNQSIEVTQSDKPEADQFAELWWGEKHKSVLEKFK